MTGYLSGSEIRMRGYRLR